MKRIAPERQEDERGKKYLRIEVEEDELILSNGLCNVLGREGLLKVFSFSVGLGLGVAARVCRNWYSLIMDSVNQGTILFRAVQCCYVENQCLIGNFRLAKKICEGPFESRSIQTVDVEYFRDLGKDVVGRVIGSRPMVEDVLLGLGPEHPDCRNVIKCVLNAEGLIDLEKISIFEDHVKIVLGILFSSVKENELDKGKGVLIVAIIEKIMPLLNDRAKIRVFGLLIDFLVEGNRIALMIMEQEGLRFYELLKSVSSKSEDLVQEVNLLVGLMAMEFSKKNSRHQNDYWVLFLGHACHERNISEMIDWTQFGLPIVGFLESNQHDFLECFSKNKMEFISFFGKLLFDRKNLDKYSILCGLNLMSEHKGLNLDEEAKVQIRLILDEYFKNRFAGMGIKMEYKILCHALIDDFNRGEFTKVAVYLESDICDFEKLEIYISRVPEKLIPLCTEEKRQDIVDLFRAKMVRKESLRLIEKGFNIYLDFFHKLYLNSSLKVKQAVMMLVGDMVLSLSRVYSNKAWVVFLELINKEPNNLGYVCGAVALAGGAFGTKKMDFIQKIRGALIEEDSGFIECFNECADRFIQFLDYQLSNIRQMSVKIDVSLTLICIVIDKNINNSALYREKIKGCLIDQFKWTPKLKEGIKEGILKMKGSYDEMTLKEFLGELSIK